MRRKKGNKLFSLLLAAAMVLSMSGTMAFAAQTNQSSSAAQSAQEDAAEQNLSFKTSKVSKTTDDAPFTNTLSGAEGKVTYTSSNAKVATVDANGKVTILGTGTATIKAVGTAAATGKSEEASFTLTVSDPAAVADPAMDATGDGDEEAIGSEDGDEEAIGSEDGDEEDAESEDGDEEDAESEDGDEQDIESEDGDEQDIESEDGDEEDIESEDSDGKDIESEDGDEEDIEAEDGNEEDIEAEDGDEEVTEAGDDEEDIEAEDGGEEEIEAEDGGEEEIEAEDGDEEDIEAEDGEEAESSTGSLIATATLPTDENLIALATYSLAPADKESQDLSFNADTVTKNVDDNPFVNPLSGAVGEVTYDSSDESVAIVDSQGWVTIEGDGTAIITATASGDEEHDLAKLSYLLSVNGDEDEAHPTGDSMNIRVAIYWEGDTESMRPEYVEVTLLADGEEQETVKVTEQEDGNWYYVWKDLPVYTDGKDKIEYTVKEINTPSGYTPTYGDWFDEENNTYSIVISDTWGVESDTGGVHGPKTSDTNVTVYSMYLLVLASAVIVMLGVRRRTVQK